jgi:hypothetical protein
MASEMIKVRITCCVAIAMELLVLNYCCKGLVISW